MTAYYCLPQISYVHFSTYYYYWN